MNPDRIVELFPEFNEIQDAKLRRKAVEATILAIREGGWAEEDLLKAPTTVNWDCPTNLVEHVRTVTRVCIRNYEELAPFYAANSVAFDRDTVVCGALLHDLGKWTEFCCRDGKVCHSDTFQLMRHPLSGAILADRAGLPKKIVHLIATHSFEGEKSYQTAESAFVRAIDDFVFRCSISGLQKK